MRRILLRLVVVAVLGAIAAVMAVPALADPEGLDAGGSGGRDTSGDPTILTGGGGGLFGCDVENNCFTAGGAGGLLSDRGESTFAQGGHSVQTPEEQTYQGGFVARNYPFELPDDQYAGRCTYEIATGEPVCTANRQN